MNYIICFKNGQKIKVTDKAYNILREKTGRNSWDDLLLNMDEVIYAQPEKDEIKEHQCQPWTYTIPNSTGTWNPNFKSGTT